jgi:serine protease Do
VGNTKPGSKSNIQVWRKGSAKDFSIVVVQMEVEKVASKKTDKESKAPANALGLVVSDLSDAKKRELKITTGVQVESVEPPASNVDLRKGDVLLRLGNIDIANAKQFDEIVKQLKPGQAVALLVYRNGNYGYVTLRPASK